MFLKRQGRRKQQQKVVALDRSRREVSMDPSLGIYTPARCQQDNPWHSSERCAARRSLRHFGPEEYTTTPRRPHELKRTQKTGGAHPPEIHIKPPPRNHPAILARIDAAASYSSSTPHLLRPSYRRQHRLTGSAFINQWQAVPPLRAAILVIFST